MTKLERDKRRAAIAASRTRIYNARIGLLRAALESALDEARRKAPRWGAIAGTIESALASDKETAKMQHPVPDPAEQAQREIPPYISGRDWLEQNPGAYAPKGKCKCGCGQERR